MISYHWSVHFRPILVKRSSLNQLLGHQSGTHPHQATPPQTILVLVILVVIRLTFMVLPVFWPSWWSNDGSSVFFFFTIFVGLMCFQRVNKTSIQHRWWLRRLTCWLRTLPGDHEAGQLVLHWRTQKLWGLRFYDVFLHHMVPQVVFCILEHLVLVYAVEPGR